MIRLAMLFMVAVIASSGPLRAAEGAVVKIVKKGDGYQLLRNGQPYFIKGGGSPHLDLLVAAGGNSIRAYGSPSALDNLENSHVTALIGLRVALPRQGFDYNNAEALAKQIENARQTVLKLKDHPAVLMWALGNEVELGASEPVRIQVWKHMNELAELIHKEDPNHPVIAVLAGATPAKLAELDRYAPALDAVGINAYGSMLSVPATLDKAGWKRPYLITEFGPRGHWEVPKTPWGLPIEDSSTEKADLYLKAYQAAVQDRPSCLGSYVFLWGQKQEKTHTWYGMFLPEGNPLGAVDAMSYAWTGKWPANRAPRIGPGKVRLAAEGSSDDSQRVFKPSARLRAEVDASDPDNDPMKVTWDVRLDVSDNPNTGGDREEPTPPIAGAIVSSSGNQALIQVPEKPANYRIFVYVFDPKGSAATANEPIVAKE